MNCWTEDLLKTGCILSYLYTFLKLKVQVIYVMQNTIHYFKYSICLYNWEYGCIDTLYSQCRTNHYTQDYTYQNSYKLIFWIPYHANFIYKTTTMDKSAEKAREYSEYYQLQRDMIVIIISLLPIVLLLT